MEKKSVSKEHQDTADPRIDRAIFSGICIGIPMLIVGIVVFAFWYLDTPEKRIQFITVNILSALVLLIVAIQAYIYRRQWKAMVDALKRTDTLLEQNERIITEMNGQVVTMREGLKQTREFFEASERPLLGVEQVICEPQKNEGCHIIIALINSGKTMAKITNLSAAYKSFNRLLDEIDNVDLDDVGENATLRDPDEFHEIQTSGIIHNGGRKLITYMTMNAGAWVNIVEGQEEFDIRLRIQYVGINGNADYFTEYYGRYSTFADGFIERPTHNDAN